MADRGYTLVELMVVVAVTSVLLVLAAPAFQRQRAQAALRTAAGQTLSALHLARRLALARGQTITVCGTMDGAICTVGGTVWLMFANDTTGSEARREAGDVVLRRWHLPRGVISAGTRGYAAFHSRPGAAATVTFAFSHPQVAGATRRIVVSQTGRPRTASP